MRPEERHQSMRTQSSVLRRRSERRTQPRHDPRRDRRSRVATGRRQDAVQPPERAPPLRCRSSRCARSLPPRYRPSSNDVPDHRASCRYRRTHSARKQEPSCLYLVLVCLGEKITGENRCGQSASVGRRVRRS